jgi:AraC-like DNA-binding protein
MGGQGPSTVLLCGGFQFEGRSTNEWKVASLASKVGMSRSAFSEKFRALVGVSPLKYVAQWRIHKTATSH